MEGKSNSAAGWDRVLKELIFSDIDFIVIGGAALALHGLPRTTLDIDIYIQADKSSFDRLFISLLDNLGLQSEQAVFRNNSGQSNLFIGQWFTFSNHDGIDVIDVFIADKKQFHSLKATSDIILMYGGEIQIASLLDLKKMKQECARPIDLADITLIDEIMQLE